MEYVEHTRMGCRSPLRCVVTILWMIIYIWYYQSPDIFSSADRKCFIKSIHAIPYAFRGCPIPCIVDCMHIITNVTYLDTECTQLFANFVIHYDDVIMTILASQITSLTVVYFIVYSGVDERRHQSSASLAFVRGIHRDRWIPRTKGQ